MQFKQTMFRVTEIPAIANNSKHDSETGYKFIIREDTNEILSCMTNDYKLITNNQIMDIALPILKEANAQLTEENAFSNGRKSIWTWKIPDIKVKIDKKDYVNPTITLKNSYDGSVQLHILAGAFRLICSNGLVIGTAISNKTNRHSVYNLNLSKLDEFIKDTINSVKTIFSSEFPYLIETKISQKHIKNLIKMFPDFTMSSLTQYLIGKKPETFWDLLNAATWVSTHTMKRNYESTHKLETQIYPSITKWAKQAANS